jgi:2-keto-3-deoxy-L-fuconate dehydrogenase
MGRLDGKVCVVTAAGQGIGRASAELMQAQGARVIATDINSKALGELAAMGMETRLLNVRDAAAVASIAAGLPETDVLFNCAGFVANGTILDCSEEEWAFSLDLNVTAAFRMCRAFLPGMIAKGGGSIVNMASVVGSIIAAPNRFAYGVTKAGVIGLTKAIAADFVTKGIRCNAVCPGTVETPSLHDRLRATGDFDAAVAAFTARQPMGRMARADEIAQLVVYLASDDSSFTTGQAHVIDGGWSNV